MSQDSFLSFLGKRPRSDSFDSQYTRIENVGSFSPFPFNMPSQSQTQASAGTQATRTRMRRAGKPMATYKRKPKITPTLRRAVKAVVSSQAETKRSQYAGALELTQWAPGNNQANADAKTLQIVPEGVLVAGMNHAYSIIAQGTARDQRVGDRINIKGQYIRYTLLPNTYNATTNVAPRPSYVQIWLIQPKVGMQNALTVNNIISGTADSDFFENPTNGASGLAGNFIDFHYGIDKENYRVLATARHKLGYQGNLNTTNVVSSQQNNDFQQLCQGTFKIPGYTLNYDRQGRMQHQPIYMIAQIVAADEVAYPVSQFPATLWFGVDTYYQDM